MTQFETAQIANLCPADAEEAKSIIPRYVSSSLRVIVFEPEQTMSVSYSLVELDDDRLQSLLDEIQTMRKFQS